MLNIQNLSLSIDTIPILQTISLAFEAGKVYALLGPNGSGKSSFAAALMGHPAYIVTQGAILYKNQDLATVAVHERARAGIFIAVQHPYALPGVRAGTFLKEAYHALHQERFSEVLYTKRLHWALELLGMNDTFLERSCNDGFSGGERKRFEILQLLLLQPQLAILDEIDSGLDVDALKIVTNALVSLYKENPTMTFIIISHYQRIFEYIAPDKVYVFRRGSLIASGDHTIAQIIHQQGYDGII